MSEDRLRAVADELEIRNLIARLAQLADDGGLDEYLSLFTEDAVWGNETLGMKTGHAEILKGAEDRRASGMAGPGAHARHVITTSAIQADGGDTASGRSVFHFYTKTDSLPELAMLGVYEDEFRRTPEGWKLARRAIIGG